MRFRYALLGLSLAFSAPAPAQKVSPEAVNPAAVPADECATGTAGASLNAAGVRAALHNTGGLFWNGRSAAYRYEVPKGSGKAAIFAAGLWVAGLVEDSLRFAGTTYGPWDFWPGPLDASGETTPEQCAAFDRIWVVGSTDLDAYAASGTATADLAEWPVGIGAPFYRDVNGNGRQDASEPTESLDLGDDGYGTRTLDLEAGERPVVFGCQTAWWVMNDAGATHRWSTTAPLGVEVQVTAWVREDPEAGDLYRSTFYRYEVINRSAAVIEDARAALFVDGDLGNFGDDYLHSDSTRSMLVFYNGDDIDEGEGGYGIPPALGIDVLSGAWGTMYYWSSGGYNGEPNGPDRAADVYHFMRSHWKDGTPLTRGGYGYDPASGDRTRWIFTGDPVAGAFWSEMNTDGGGLGHLPSDRRGLITAEPVRLMPGGRYTVDIAILFAWGDDRFDSITDLRAISDLAQSQYDAGHLTEAMPTSAETGPEAAALSLAVHPNPVRTTASVPYTLAASGRVRLSILDVLGREAAVLEERDRAAGDHRASFDARGLAAGVYVVVLDAEAARTTRTVTVVR